MTNFCLSSAGGSLKKASAEVHEGKGFCVIRGLEPNSLSDEDNLTAFLGVASHVGGDRRGVQDTRGNVIGMFLLPTTCAYPSICLLSRLTPP